MNECEKGDIATSYDEISQILDNLYKLENKCVLTYLSRKNSGLAISMVYPRPNPLFKYTICTSN